MSQQMRLAPARRDILGAGSVDPVLAIFNRAALVAHAWLDPSPEASSRIFGDAIESMLSGQATADTAVTYISGQLLRIANQNGN